MIEDRIKEAITNTADFPKSGIVFRNVFPIFIDPCLTKDILTHISDLAFQRGIVFDAICGIEARGFLLGSILAYERNIKFVPVRKAGKLPGETLRKDYDLEYGTATLEISPALLAGVKRVLIVDDLIATGGTAKAAVELIKACDPSIEIAACCFIVELTGLEGRKQLQDCEVISLVEY